MFLHGHAYDLIIDNHTDDLTTKFKDDESSGSDGEPPAKRVKQAPKRFTRAPKRDEKQLIKTRGMKAQPVCVRMILFIDAHDPTHKCTYVFRRLLSNF